PHRPEDVRMRDQSPIRETGLGFFLLSRLGIGASSMKIVRLGLALATTALTALILQSCDKPAPKQAQAPFNVIEASIGDMQAAMKDGRTTSRQIVAQYLTRIGTYEDKLHAAVAVNPNALAEAEALDKERAAGHVRGPLHGIPIALKDNIMDK